MMFGFDKLVKWPSILAMEVIKVVNWKFCVSIRSQTGVIAKNGLLFNLNLGPTLRKKNYLTT